MAKKKKKASKIKTQSATLRLEGRKSGEDSPEIELQILDREGTSIAVAGVDEDGAFEVPITALDKAHRVRLGPASDRDSDGEGSDSPADSSVFLTYRAVDFGAILENGILDIGRNIWEGWFRRRRCVSGTVSRCRRSPWWYLELARAARGKPTFQRIGVRPGAFDLDELIRWPVRCTRICLGTVEVFRRICCCEPWVFEDPRFDDLLRELEDITQGIPEIPDFPDPPGPDPDPAPFRRAFLQDGALDERVLRASQELNTLRSLTPELIPDYINVRPHLLCRSYSCGHPVKVAEGTIGPDGRFNICWSEFPTLLHVGCHEEFAYRVKQKIGPFHITIYDGVSASHWYQRGDEAHLHSFHPWAIACRDNGGPGDAFVYLDEIGDTDSSLLGTPDQATALSVDPPGANGGVAFPTGGPAGNGSHDRNWGGTLKLGMMFSESMRNVGARYYRISVTRADANGNPAGPREYVTRALEWNKAIAVPGGVDVVPVALGPTSTVAPATPRDHLFEIPYDGDLGSNADWEADQYHAILDTAEASKLWSDPGAAVGSPARRHLVTVEVFNANGQRLRPNGTPATGLGGAEVEAAFTYRRKTADTGPTDMVPYGALTHLFWWDNREVVAKIEDLRMDGLQSDDECQFLSGISTSTFGIGYRAYHPWELFQKGHTISWKRGLSGGSGQMLNSTSNVGVPPAAEGSSPTHEFGYMLNHPTPGDPPHTRCAFTVSLTTSNKRTDGDDLGYGQKKDSAAFALDIEAGS